MKVSIIIPVYNEAQTLEEIIRRVQAADIQKEVIIVDDGSVDSTGNVLRDLHEKYTEPFLILSHDKNGGKGKAIRTALASAMGDLVLIQDADLEYNPNDYPALLAPFADPEIKVVYGSRNLRPNPHSSFAFYWGGRFLSMIANLLFGSNLTDITTGYKIFSAGLLKEIPLSGNGFDFCVEITAKILQRGIQIVEVPISYTPRSWKEGKKIQWHDGLKALLTLLKYRFIHESPHVENYKALSLSSIKPSGHRYDDRPGY